MTTTKNIAKSVHQKLKNLAQKNSESVENILYRYAIERLLYRLSQSKYKNQFLLKGAFLFTIWSEPFQHRITRDVDFLHLVSNDLKTMEAIFKDICTNNVYEDGLHYDMQTIEAEIIRKEDIYGGIRITLMALLDKAKIHLQADIGFGDIVTPNPIEEMLPTLLDMPAPRLKIYPIYTVIAEKFEAMVLQGINNSRMKDFYDIHFLANNFDVDGAQLVQAIVNTFTRRQTPLPNQTPIALTETFYKNPEKQIQWNAFLRKNRLTTEQMTLESTVLRIGQFLMIPLESALLKSNFNKTWNKNNHWT